MCGSLAVILANLSLKEYAFALRQKTVGTEIQPMNDINGLYPCCCRNVTYGSKEVKYESCRN